ncbi:MAG TPA: HVO_0476 family zinc finger protein [Methanospirillum sp.]|uniref:HVO_0476 family zinc finger protein n=1 Tax=Methanospirillum sp. TaxID=45200 RepID=UPI002C2BA252|nr:HVO_0476 family zinc finger protein [Methanospirillum sp.]HOJ97639.1 HVO_0476 family zinc finger protein [Methanospirillum sp.]HOL41863.1 HVO_0476 family zinc finger protein [Methanospirillum sp.]HPP78021.1 HVO_0476 family zinc finger protein [Methanospirillum sp.]
MDLIDAYCATCKEETEQEVLSEARDLIIRCTVCGLTSRRPLPPEPEPIYVKTIVSREAESYVGRAELMKGEIVSVGDHIVAERDDGEVAGVEIMSLEVGDKRVTKAAAEEIDTIWSRAIDEVIVRISVHDGKKTIPLYVACEGDERFTIDEIVSIDRIRARIDHICLRNGMIQRRKGKYEVANRIKRIYAYRL